MEAKINVNLIFLVEDYSIRVIRIVETAQHTSR